MPVPPEYADDRFMPPESRYLLVFVGPASVKHFNGKRIPLDGRKYVCNGNITLASGQTLRAKLVVDTTDLDLLDLDATYVHFRGLWYGWDEDALYSALGQNKGACLPFVWEPDTPLEYYRHAPYPMKLVDDGAG